MLLSSVLLDVGVYPYLFPCSGKVTASVPLQLLPRSLSLLCFYTLVPPPLLCVGVVMLLCDGARSLLLSFVRF